MTPLKRRTAIKTLGAAAMFGVTPWAAANNYPTRSIRWLIPYNAGGGTDVVCRLIAKYWEPIIGSGFVIDNKPGGQTVIATQALQSSRPDGYTILTVADGFPLLPLIFKNLPFDIEKDFDYIGTMTKVPHVLVVHPDSKIRNIADAFAEMKKQGKKMTYATYGVGSLPHLITEAICDVLGTDLTHVPYKGAAEQISALLSGTVDIMSVDTLVALPLIRNGKLRPLALTINKSSPSFKGVPTLAESGIPGFNYFSWHAVIAPRGLPTDVRDKLSVTLRKTLESPEIKSYMEERAWEVFNGTPDDLRKQIATYGQQARELIARRKLDLTAG